MSAIRSIRAAALALAASLPLAALAGGPLNVCSGAAIKYASNTVTLNYDQGVLGSRTKANSDALVTNAISLWTNVPTANINLVVGTPLPVDVVPSNFGQYDMFFGSSYTYNGNPVIYDSDGSILESFYGLGASDSILGFAGSGGSCAGYTRGEAVLNGKPTLSGGYVISDATMTTTVAHEVGHLIGLDHTQLNSTQGGIAQSANWPLMYPVAYRTAAGLHEDDVAAVTALYPETSAIVNAAYGQLTGNFTTVGGAPIMGANIFAQGTGGSFSVVSDFLMQNNGFFRFYLPPGTYTLRAGAIQTDFTGGSSVGPYSDTWNLASFQPPMYSGGGSEPTTAQPALPRVTPTGPLSVIALGGNTAPTQITITAGCAATVTFNSAGTGSVGGNCNPAPPATPTPIAPTGTITTTTPTFTWNAVANATTYTIELYDSLGLAATYNNAPAAANCAANTGQCSFTPSALSSNTPYSWRVRASNSGGASAFSGWLSFNISPTAPPAQPVTVSPTGSGAATTPTYTWNAVANATSYDFMIQNAGTGATVLSDNVAASAVGCGAGTGTCSRTPSTTLTLGVSYTWSVAARNAGGASAWSVARNFTVGSPPATPMPVSPSGTVTTATPAFVFNAVANATSYNVEAWGPAGLAASYTATPSQAGCPSNTGQCSIASTVALANNTAYSWRVRAFNSTLVSAYSGWTNFTVTQPAPATPVPVSPTGTVSTTTPSFVFNAAANATSYAIEVWGPAGLAASYAATPSQAGCPSNTGQCTVASTTALTNGTGYSWRMRASSSTGTSAFSGWINFTVSVSSPPPPTAPAVPSPISPAGSTGTTTPAFTFNAVANATTYAIEVWGPAGLAASYSVTPAQANCPSNTGQCSYTGSTALADNTGYSWRMRALNDAGASGFSGWINFTVAATPTPTPTPVPPATPSAISPTGTIATATPAFTFNAVVNVTSYAIEVWGPAGLAASYSVTPAQANCPTNSGQCSYTGATALANNTGYSWRMRALNDVGASGYSGWMNFTVATGTTPAVPTTFSPTGAIGTRTPTFTFGAVANAMYYEVEVWGPAGLAASYNITAPAACAPTPCQIGSTVTLAAATGYSWRMRATNGSLASAFSGWKNFTTP